MNQHNHTTTTTATTTTATTTTTTTTTNNNNNNSTDDDQHHHHHPHNLAIVSQHRWFLGTFHSSARFLPHMPEAYAEKFQTFNRSVAMLNAVYKVGAAVLTFWIVDVDGILVTGILGGGLSTQYLPGNSHNHGSGKSP